MKQRASSCAWTEAYVVFSIDVNTLCLSTRKLVSWPDRLSFSHSAPASITSHIGPLISIDLLTWFGSEFTETKVESEWQASHQSFCRNYPTHERKASVTSPSSLPARCPNEPLCIFNVNELLCSIILMDTALHFVSIPALLLHHYAAVHNSLKKHSSAVTSHTLDQETPGTYAACKTCFGLFTYQVH